MRGSEESSPTGRITYYLSVQDIKEFIAKIITILQVIICDDLRRGSMLNSGNNDRDQNWLLL
jgi:hypothetical protein